MNDADPNEQQVTFHPSVNNKQILTFVLRKKKGQVMENSTISRLHERARRNTNQGKDTTTSNLTTNAITEMWKQRREDSQVQYNKSQV